MNQIAIFLTAGWTIFASTTLATSPPMKAPPAPIVSARDAIQLADAYVAKTFPQFSDLDRAEMRYNTDESVDSTVVWHLTYYLPNNPRKNVPGNIWGDIGLCTGYPSTRIDL